jgi:hypothetical protein
VHAPAKGTPARRSESAATEARAQAATVVRACVAGLVVRERRDEIVSL